MKKYRSIAAVWAIVAAFAFVLLKGLPIEPNIVFNKNLGYSVNGFVFVIAAISIAAIEFTARKLRSIREVSEKTLQSQQVSLEESVRITVNEYSSATREYVDVATQPLKIVSE